MSKRSRPTKRRRFFQIIHPRFRKKSTSECLESTISSKRLPVSTFKDAVHLSPNDDYYLVTDSEGNIGNMRFFRPIPEPQVTEPELLQENKNDIVGNKILHCGKLMDMFNKFYKEHGQNEPRCELSCNWNTNNCQKWGLSWRLGLKCDNCNFCGEKTKVYTESDTDTKKGQKYSTVNLGIHVGLQSSRRSTCIILVSRHTRAFVQCHAKCWNIC
ncbi:hypothetical protein [uncultured Gammaproteobacteria bacterium]|nr:hypothetical protein [uncultured Gammaproteobacteria bacterium]